MPTMYSCHDPYVQLPIQDHSLSILRNVPHISQQAQWDCGVAAVAMMCAYTLPKFYDPITAYSSTLTCLRSVIPSAAASCPPPAPALSSTTVVDVDAAKTTASVANEDNASLNGLWTIHLVLALRRLLDAPRRHLQAPHCCTTGPSGNLVELSREEREEAEGSMELQEQPQRRVADSVESPTSTTLADLNAELSSSLDVQVTFFTTCLGVNPQHFGETYYAATVASDAEHVASAFAELQELQDNQQRDGSRVVVSVQKRLTTTRDLIEIMQEEESGDAELIFLCLVDASKLQCRCHEPTTWAGAAWNLLGYVMGSYTGHYVVLCGYDKATDQVLYRNPAVPGGSIAGTGYLCAEPVVSFDAARSSEGTDHDTVLLRLC